MPREKTNRISVKCIKCGIYFSARKYRLLLGKDKYCSKSCYQPGFKQPKINDLFWKKVTIGRSNECWPYNGAKSTEGYGTLFYGRTSIKSHRLAYILSVGPIPEGKLIMHTCDNPKCCNPGHLKPGTDAENSADRKSKNRGHRPIGIKNVKAKISESDVLKIREIHKINKNGYAKTAKEFGVNPDTIGNIVRRETWTHLL